MLDYHSVRKKPQVIAIQIIATVALIILFLLIYSLYPINKWGVDPENLDANGDGQDDQSSYNVMMLVISPNVMGGDLGAGEWAFHMGAVGLLILGLSMGYGFSLLHYVDERIKLISARALIIMALIFLVGQSAIAIATEGLTSPRAATALELPIVVYIQLFFILALASPAIFGMLGIWGIRSKHITISLVLSFIIIMLYALFAISGTPWEETLFTEGSAFSTTTAARELVFWYQLIGVGLLMLLFAEMGYANVRFSEYAYRLPDEVQSDPNYDEQFDNQLNYFLIWNGFLLAGTFIITLVAVLFNTFVVGLPFVPDQIENSVEINLVYGIIISAFIFLILAGFARLAIPWLKVKPVSS